MTEIPDPITRVTLDPAEPDGQRLRALLDRLATAIDQLEAADDAWNTLTTAQKLAALRLSVRVSAAVARLVLGRIA